MSGSSPAARAARRIARPIRRLPSIRAKLGSTIVVAVAVSLGLVFVLLSFALRNDFREADLVELLGIAQSRSRAPAPVAPPGVSIAHLREAGAFVWFGDPLPEPPRFTTGVHVGVARGVAYAAVPLRAEAGEGMLYAVREEPDLLAASTRFLLQFWWQLLAAGLVGSASAIAFARWLARGMTRPLRDMADAARDMATGDYSRRVETDSRDEVGELAVAFNRMAADLAALEGLRRDLVANVSHELKTPISALRARLENLLDGVEAPDPGTLSVMLAQSERLGRLVDQLLDLARLESGAATFRREPVDVGALVGRVLSEFAVAGGGRHLASEVPAALPPVEGDAERLHQVVFNLVDNAVRFTPDGGEVAVRAVATDGRVRLEVEDAGPGIPEHLRERVFERFYRVDPARSREDGGTGIGLAIARSIVTGHGGRIWVEAGTTGGSRFVVDLPRGAPADPR
ncbi:MAG: sensor histidine kinase [Actinomycetota bacterium]